MTGVTGQNALPSAREELRAGVRPAQTQFLRTEVLTVSGETQRLGTVTYKSVQLCLVRAIRSLNY